MNISGPFKPVRTQAGAIRQYKAIIRELRRQLAGGLSFGMDWSTLRASYPEAAARLWELRHTYKA